MSGTFGLAKLYSSFVCRSLNFSPALDCRVKGSRPFLRAAFRTTSKNQTKTFENLNFDMKQNFGKSGLELKLETRRAQILLSICWEIIG